jgi:hypothetical protein
VAGITWNKYAFEHFDAAAIGYAWVDSEGSAGSLRGRGLGSQAFGFALESARQVSAGRLAWIILEANRPDSVGGAQDSTVFWRKRGFYSLDSARYAVPGLPFDPESGEAAGDDIGLELMLRPVGSREGNPDTPEDTGIGAGAWIDRERLLVMVERIHKSWYEPQFRDFASLAAFTRAQRHRESLFADFVESLRVDGKGQVGLV